MERRAKPAEALIVDMERDRAAGSRLYPEVAREVKDEQIAAAVEQQRQILAASYRRGRVDLHDAPAVRAQIDAYLTACQETSTIPTLLALSAALGLSRTRVYAFCQQYPDSESAQLIDQFRTSAAAVLAQGALTRTLDNSTSIFLLKNCGQGLQDSHLIETEARPQVEQAQSPESIAAKYSALPSD